MFPRHHGLIQPTRSSQPCRLPLLAGDRGNREWTGDWSDKSEKWSDGVRRVLGWSKKNDGTFWMTWQGVVGLVCVRNSYHSGRECKDRLGVLVTISKVCTFPSRAFDVCSTLSFVAYPCTPRGTLFGVGSLPRTLFSTCKNGTSYILKG